MDTPNQREWINARDIRNEPLKPRTPPSIDIKVSEIVGRDIYVNDPQLIRWAASKSKQNRSETEPTNMLDDKVNRRELVELFHGRSIQ